MSFALRVHNGSSGDGIKVPQSARKESHGSLAAADRAEHFGRGRTPNTFPRVTSQSQRDMSDVRKVLFDDANQGADIVPPNIAREAFTQNGSDEADEGVVLNVTREEAYVTGKRADVVDDDGTDSEGVDEVVAAVRSRIQQLDDMESQLHELKQQQMVALEREHERLMSATFESARFGESAHRDQESDVIRTVMRDFAERAPKPPVPSAPPPRVPPVGSRAASQSVASRPAHATSPRAAAATVDMRDAPALEPESKVAKKVFAHLVSKGIDLENVTDEQINDAILKVIEGEISMPNAEWAEFPAMDHMLSDSAAASDRAVNGGDDGDDVGVMAKGDEAQGDSIQSLEAKLHGLQMQMQAMREMADMCGITLPVDEEGLLEPVGAVNAVLDDDDDDDDDDGDDDDGDVSFEVNPPETYHIGMQNSRSDDPPEDGIYGDDDLDALDNDNEAMSLELLASLQKQLSDQRQVRVELEERQRLLADKARLENLVRELEPESDADGAEESRETQYDDAQESACVTDEEIYKEVSQFILQNDNRPAFVLNLFKALRGMTSDYECERLLAATDDIKRFCARHPELKGPASAPVDNRAAQQPPAPPPTQKRPVPSKTAAEPPHSPHPASPSSAMAELKKMEDQLAQLHELDAMIKSMGGDADAKGARIHDIMSALSLTDPQPSDVAGA